MDIGIGKGARKEKERNLDEVGRVRRYTDGVGEEGKASSREKTDDVVWQSDGCGQEEKEGTDTGLW